MWKPFEKELALRYKGAKRYDGALEEVIEQGGSIGGPIGIPGWKGLSKAQLKYLYRKGCVPAEYALKQYGAELNNGDHAAMLQAIKDEDLPGAVQALGEAGVSLKKVERAGRAAETRKLRGTTGGRKRVSKVPYTDTEIDNMTLDQLQAAMAVVEHNKLLAEQAAKAAPGLKGYEVLVTPDLEAELLERHGAKGKAMIK